MLHVLLHNATTYESENIYENVLCHTTCKIFWKLFSTVVYGLIIEGSYK